MSDTPRTDENRLPVNSHGFNCDIVRADCARELERENAALKAHADALAEALEVWGTIPAGAPNELAAGIRVAAALRAYRNSYPKP